MNVKDLLAEALSELKISIPFIELEVPREEVHGDISTPVAMVIAGQLKKSPKKIAEDIIRIIGSNEMLERIDVAGPGFLNFFLSREFLYSELKSFLENPSACTRRDSGHGKRLQIEFVSANPTGPLHLGHGRGAAVGSALATLLKRGGYDVQSEFYINDAGRQVNLLGESVFARYMGLCDKDYPFPEEGYKGEYILDTARDIYEREGGKYCSALFSECSEYFVDNSYRIMLADIKKDLEGFGVVFDSFQSERDLYSEGCVAEMIEKLRGKELIYEKDGATWFRSTEYGDDKDRVIIKNDGEYTYFASDIAYHYLKIEKGFDELINIWGADHHGYAQRIRSTVSAFGYDAKSLKILLVQMVTLLRGGKPVQMSKRAGKFITLREVIEEIGTDITRFIFLTRRADSHLEFDLETAKKHSAENPVFYVQYAYARINSIFRKAEDEGYRAKDLDLSHISLLVEEEELRLIKKVIYYPIVFDGAVHAREPHRITYFIQELAGLFHHYYNKHRVLTAERKLSTARLSLCRSIMNILNEGLSLLGISAPERM